MLPKQLRTTIAKRVLRFASHLLVYSVANFAVVTASYYTVEYKFSQIDKITLLSGFTLCFLLFEFIFCIFSLMFMLVEESRKEHKKNFTLKTCF